MNARSRSAMNEPSPWYALHEYLVAAYSNPEMRRLVEISLLPEAGHSLPDDRVPAHEYASAICTFIQRHSSMPSPEFWRQLLSDRPMRRTQIVKLRGAFCGSTYAASVMSQALERDQRAWWRRAAQALAVAGILGFAFYCASNPNSAATPKPAPTTIECNDGTFSPTCTEARSGCCSGHGGIRDGTAPAPAK